MLHFGLECGPGFEDEIYQEDIDQIKALLMSQPSSAQAASAGGRLQIVLNSGATVARTGDGRIGTNMFGGTMIGKSLNINGFVLNAAWSDKQLTDALKQFGIAQVLYA